MEGAVRASAHHRPGRCNAAVLLLAVRAVYVVRFPERRLYRKGLSGAEDRVPSLLICWCGAGVCQLNCVTSFLTVRPTGVS